MKVAMNLIKGMIPRIKKDKLPDEYGRVCTNADLDSGAIKGYRAPLEVQAAATDPTAKSLYEYDKGGTRFWNDWPDEVDVVTNPVADDAYDRVYFSGIEQTIATHPYYGQKDIRAFANDLESGGAGTHDQDVDWYSVGIWPGNKPTLAASGTPASTVDVTRAVCYTYVSKYGEEGPPSEPEFITLKDDININVTFESLASVLMTAANKYYITNVNVYMSTVNSSNYATFNYVATHSITGESDTGPITVAATPTVGEQLSTVDYDTPRINMLGLVQTSNGLIAGFRDKRVMFSKPYLPYAWGGDDEIQLPHRVVGLGVIGTTVVAVTEGYPYFIDGANPESLQSRKIPQFFPGVSKRSVVSAENSVMYASTTGVVMVDFNGAQNITDQFLTKPEYEDYIPAQMNCQYYDGKYHAFSTENDDGYTGFILDIRESKFVALKEYVVNSSVLNQLDGKLYITHDVETTETISQWDGNNLELLQYTLMSKEYRLPRRVNFSTGRVWVDEEFIADLIEDLENNTTIIAANQTILNNLGVQLNNPPTTEYTFGAFNEILINQYTVNGDPLTDLLEIAGSTQVTFNLYADNELVFSRSISTDKPFKMPGGYKSKKYQFEIIGSVPVTAIELATTMRELTI